MPCYHVDGFDHNANDDDDDDNEDDDDHDDKGDDDLMQKEASSRAGEESSIEMCGEAGFEVRTSRASTRIYYPDNHHRLLKHENCCINVSNQGEGFDLMLLPAPSRVLIQEFNKLKHTFFSKIGEMGPSGLKMVQIKVKFPGK